ncbi:hypothetical protein [Marinisporobacter balticus]|uniref:Uncharacterized protein n=1 Tax=Marinisporobacter balticus TaxID=2018667 RepID=A0A4R2KD18_9FIRM|nr:hypothetical protein [Marinisporobacter balticus]TCO68099.1 hypothetical protein EV214_14810 [Marinisporobacter balticus]
MKLKIWQEKLFFFLITVLVGVILAVTIGGPIVVVVMGAIPLLYHLSKTQHK